LRLHHIGIVVRDLAAQGAAYADTLGSIPCSEVIHDPVQKVRVQFWRHDAGSLIELIEPVSEDSPAWRSSRQGGGLDHLCYETENLDLEIERCLQKGGMLTREVSPAVAFGGRRIAFVYFLELGLIEFVESEKPNI
jgi:methylmalonyl-CoA/ethylmalonyl-CoA epimerase